jgi:hypothetical protein
VQPRWTSLDQTHFIKNQLDHDFEAFHQEIRDRALAIGQKIGKEVIHIVLKKLNTIYF